MHSAWYLFAGILSRHNDLPWQYRVQGNMKVEEVNLRGDLRTVWDPAHTDILRLKAGMLGAQVSIYLYTPADAVYK